MATAATTIGRRSRLATLLLLGALALGLAGCSPEGARVRGGGAGADVGNRDEDEQLQGEDAPQDRIYYDTPLYPSAPSSGEAEAE